MWNEDLKSALEMRGEKWKQTAKLFMEKREV